MYNKKGCVQKAKFCHLVGNEPIPIPPHCVQTTHHLQGPDSAGTGVIENPDSTKNEFP